MVQGGSGGARAPPGKNRRTGATHHKSPIMKMCISKTEYKFSCDFVVWLWLAP